MELLDELESAVKRGDAETAYKLAIRGERPQQERRFAELKGKVRNIRAYRCAFIHVPKAGGTSLQKVVQDIGGFSIGHRAISDAYQLPPVDYYCPAPLKLGQKFICFWLGNGRAGDGAEAAFR